MTTAPEYLRRAAEIMDERGKQYDSPNGERSMGRCVVAFNALTGRDLEEAEGWLFQQLLKDARQWSGGKSQEKTRRYHRDSAEDSIAYAALKAEALEHERTSTDDTLPMEVGRRAGQRNKDHEMTHGRRKEVTSGKNERNEKMFEAVIRGGTFSAIAESEGVTTERARQVVHKMRRMMMHPKRLGTSVVPDADFYKVSELRKHASFWLEQLAKWRAEHGFSDRVDGATEPASSPLMGKRPAP